MHFNLSMHVTLFMSASANSLFLPLFTLLQYTFLCLWAKFFLCKQLYLCWLPQIPYFDPSLQYTFVGNEGPAVLLVHGFGAFLEHFRDNIDNIADMGHRVWAITLVGFGKSEKPNVNYSELFWSELLRDFIIDVVREPVHLVGNSIGGTDSIIKLLYRWRDIQFLHRTILLKL